MGEYDKAEKKAMEQLEVRNSREVLLTPIFDGKKGERYRGEAVLALLHELSIVIDWAIARNDKLVNSKEGIEISLACYDEALEFFDSAYVHYMKFLERQNEDCFEDDYFDTPLLSAVGNTSIPVIVCKSEFFENSLSYLPENVKVQIMTNPKYAGLFEK